MTVSKPSVSQGGEECKPTSWVYFIRAGEDGPIKIGFTGGSPYVRMRDLQTGNHERLRLLGAVPGTSKDENAFHRRFGDLRGEGEWFRPEPRLIQFIEDSISYVVELPIIAVGKFIQRLGDQRIETGLTAVHVALLFAIASYQSTSEWSVTSQGTIARTAFMNERTARDGLRDLVAHGWLSRREIHGERGKEVHYRLTLGHGRLIEGRHATKRPRLGASTKSGDCDVHA